MNTHLNLFPLAYRRRQLLRKRLRQWFVAWGLAAAACAALAWSQWSQLHASALQLDSLRSQHAPVEKAKSETEQLRQRIEELKQRETLALALADEQSMLILMGCLSRAARQCNGELAIQELKLERRVKRETAGDVWCVLTLDGAAANQHAVVRFTEALKSSQLFDRVELKQTGTADVGGRQTTTYHMECVF